MGRPPCCDKTGVKKGPWTPEEDIMLVSYIQEHGPGNWRAVPTSTGLRRCSKSCRLRWTNYLRPGIKRGNFSDQEEKMIIQLQALLGNKWAAIASYLPERTDNDIKNFWNTHLKKKLKKHESCSETTSTDEKEREKEISSSQSHSATKGQWERRLQTDIHTAKQALRDALTLDSPKSTPTKLADSPCYVPDTKLLCNIKSKPSPITPYAANSDNIARLLKGWMKNSPAISPAPVKVEQVSKSCSSTQHSFYNSGGADCMSSGESKIGMDMSEAFESLFGFQTFESSTSEFSPSASPEDGGVFQGESKQGGGRAAGEIPLSAFENWLLDDGGVQHRLDLANFSFDAPSLFQ